MRLAKQWINTIICAIDSVFVVEEVLRRGRRSSQTRQTVQQQSPIVHHEEKEKKEFLSVDINKLDAAFKSGMFHRH